MRNLRLSQPNLAYSIDGEGDAVVMIHGSLSEADTLLRTAPALGDYARIGYDRPGYGDSPAPQARVTLESHARDVSELLKHIGVERAHVVGHSYGGDIALQFAHDYPELTRSVTLIEPALPSVLFANEQINASFGQIMQKHASGELHGAMDIFLTGFCGPRYRETLESTLPEGCIDRAVAGMRTVLEVDLPALQTWTFGPAQAAKINRPVFSLIGKESGPLFEAIDGQLEAWFPNRERADIRDANHLMTLQQPALLAETLARFFATVP